MTTQHKIDEAIKLLVSAQAELAGNSAGNGNGNASAPRGINAWRVTDFLKAETVAGDKVEAKLCWERFRKCLQGDERYAWNRNLFYSELRQRGHRVTPGTKNINMVHGLELKASQ